VNDNAAHLPIEATARRVRAEVPERADVVIIGAGLGGLMTAARLAQEGRRVVVLDQHYVAGGCATMLARGRGGARYCFDVGLHYVGECGPGGKVSRMLDEVGVAVDWRPLDEDGFDELIFPDFRFAIPASIDRYRDRLVEMFPSERAGIDRYIRLCREVRHLGRDGAPRGWSQAVDAVLHGRLAAWNREATLADFLDTCTRDPRLRAVIAGQNGDYGLPPSRVSLMLHAGLTNHYLGGAWYPRGGGQVIADGLAARIEALGSSIHLRHTAGKVMVEDGKAVGVRYHRPHGGLVQVRAPVVVSNADPGSPSSRSRRSSPSSLPRGRRPSTGRWAGRSSSPAWPCAPTWGPSACGRATTGRSTATTWKRSTPKPAATRFPIRAAATSRAPPGRTRAPRGMPRPA
jgi:phytoene dehydrogenase-like protein